MRKAIVLLVVLAVLVAVPASAQTFANTFDHILAQTIRTTGDAAFGDDVTVADTLAVSGAASAASVSVTGAAVVGTQLSLAPQDAIAVTDGAYITPTGTLQRLSGVGNAWGWLGVPQSGQLVTFINQSNVTITISDTTGQVLAGNAALGQWDTLTVVGYGTAWHEVARANN